MHQRLLRTALPAVLASTVGLQLALAERVRKLQDEIEAARRQTPPQVEYRVVVAPPVATYVGDWAPVPAHYGYAAPLPYTTECNASRCSR